MIRTVELDRSSLSMLVLAGGGALIVGVLAAATSPLVPAAALLALVVVALIWWRPVLGTVLFVTVVATLPFGVIPVRIAGAQLTLVDAVLIATFSAVLGRLAFGGWRLPVGAPGLALVAFVLVVVAALLASTASSPAAPELLRRVGKLIASLLFFLIARGILTTRLRLERLTQVLMVAGAIQGAIGAGLMALSPGTQLTLLSRLQVIGYPATDVLRYVPGPNNTYTNQLRAIGTSVDPNVFGGTLMLALALIVVQWAAPRPLLPRLVLAALALPTAVGLLLSLSRASWLGLAIGVLLVGALRYRRIVVLGLVVGVALLASPQGQEFITRFVSGFSIADRATAFRVGEYGNAFTLIQRYPVLGIGFGLSPDIDVTAGVSSVYLLVAEQTGLVGLAVYVAALLTTWWTGAQGLRRTADTANRQADGRFAVDRRADPAHERLLGLQAAYLAALTGALVAGSLDHYFANQDFPHAVALFWLYAAGLVAVRTLTASQSAVARQSTSSRAAPGRPSAQR